MKAFVAFVFFVLGLTAPIVYAGPQLLADMRAGSDWAPAFDLHVTGAHCTRWEAIVSTCSIDYSGPTKAEVMPQLRYLVFGGWAGEHTMLMRSERVPDVVTTIQGVRDLRAREITLGVWIVFAALAILSMGLAILRKSSVAVRISVADAPASTARPMVSPASQPVAGARAAFGRRGL